MNETPACLEVLTAYFGDAGCSVIAVTDVEQALSICSVAAPDLMVLAQAQSGIDELDELRARHPNCRVVVTAVLDPGAVQCAAAQNTATRSLAAAPN
jgi:DNA-binding response OmpR family regulator